MSLTRGVLRTGAVQRINLLQTCLWCHHPANPFIHLTFVFWCVMCIADWPHHNCLYISLYIAKSLLYPLPGHSVFINRLVENIWGAYLTFLSFICLVPCGPNVTADLDCRSQVLTLSWDATSNAEGYTTVVSNNNETENYINTEPGLMLSTLECGLDHKLKVTSFNSTCVSRPTVLSKRESKSCFTFDIHNMSSINHKNM